MHETLTLRIIGYVASLLLTLAAFLAVAYPDALHLQTQTIILFILIFAILQAFVQSVCFLHILSEKKPRWNLFIFASTISIIIVIIAFSIWIMNHLNYNMML
jgi:cytochrome o ubiquinol oxidase operon protein cyoD